VRMQRSRKRTGLRSGQMAEVGMWKDAADLGPVDGRKQRLGRKGEGGRCHNGGGAGDKHQGSHDLVLSDRLPGGLSAPRHPEHRPGAVEREINPGRGLSHRI